MSKSLSRPQTNTLICNKTAHLFVYSFVSVQIILSTTPQESPAICATFTQLPFTVFTVCWQSPLLTAGCNAVDVGTTYTATDTLSEPSSNVASQLSVCCEPTRQQPNPFIISPLNFCTSINMLFQEAAVILKSSSFQRTNKVSAFGFLCNYRWVFCSFGAVLWLNDYYGYVTFYSMVLIRIW